MYPIGDLSRFWRLNVTVVVEDLGEYIIASLREIEEEEEEEEDEFSGLGYSKLSSRRRNSLVTEVT